MNEYEWAEGARFNGDAQSVGEELNRIAKTAGLTPESVVACAKSKRSVLHGYVYDGTTPDEALEKYRLSRAGSLIKSVVIKVEQSETETITVRAFHRTVDEGSRSWREVHEIAADRMLTLQVEKRLRGEMRSLKTQLDYFQAFPEVSAAIDLELIPA